MSKTRLLGGISLGMAISHMDCLVYSHITEGAEKHIRRINLERKNRYGFYIGK